MLAKVLSASFIGVEGYIIEVEVDTQMGIINLSTVKKELKLV